MLVTGGGGSIGSELCRQIAHAKPKQLIILDIYENNAYDIQMELRRTHPELNPEVIIGSVRDAVRLNHVMETYRPELVFHAAAHKHVPLMEESPNEAIKNNVIGTYKLAKAAAEYGVKRFVQISTDKAVNPTNIMGASKRLCEMVIQMMNRKSKTEFVAVRFGNVLGSNGSVIPLFKKQIEAGGPVTVTHPDIIRYFMTIPEAVSLVLQAGYYARGGEIFVLDMGQPVKIDDMARQLIRLSGFEPDVDIPIIYTGLRPGEKLTLEELLYGLLLCSGNDAALALTECAGGVAPFVERMNEKAAALGMRNSHFANPNGLDDEAHYSTAYDMALLGCAAVNEPTLRRMVSTRTAVIGGRTLTNHNKLLSRLDGCVGLKTGYTKAAGRTLVSCAEQAGHRLVAVTLRDGDDWNDHEALYRWGFLLTGIQETLETRLLGALGNGREVSP